MLHCLAQGGRIQHIWRDERIVEVDWHAQGTVGDPAGNSGPDPPDQMQRKPKAQTERMAIDQRKFFLQDVSTLLGVAEPSSGDASADPGEFHSAQHTRAYNSRVFPEPGEHFVIVNK